MKITDEMLYQSVAEAREIWLDTLPDDSEIPEHEFSEEFNREMDRLIGLSQKRKKSGRRIRRIAAMFAAVLIGSGAWLSVDLEARAAFTKWIRSVWSDGVVYHFVGESSGATISDYHCAWLPEGMEASELYHSDDQGYTTYLNTDGGHVFLDYSYMDDGSAHFITPSGEEGLRHEVVEINGMPGDFYIEKEAGHSHVLLWFDEEENIAFTLHSDLMPEDILRMAGSVEKGAVLELMPEYECTWLPDDYSAGEELYCGSHARKISSLNEMKDLSLEYEIFDAATLEEHFWIESETPGISVTVRGTDAVLYLNTHRDEHSLLWLDEDNGIAFRLDASEDAETMVAIAEAVRRKE